MKSQNNTNQILSLLIIFIGAITFWLFSERPDCMVWVTRYQKVLLTQLDTTTAKAPCQIIEVTNSGIEKGMRPHPVQTTMDRVKWEYYHAFGEEYTEDYYYVNQMVSLRNKALEPATFTMQGWVILSALPNLPVTSEKQSIRLAPDEIGTLRFQIELPSGYHHKIIDYLNTENCQIEATKVKCISKKSKSVWKPIKVKCNNCRENCVDELPPSQDDNIGKKTTYPNM